jgi:hypothetical protein
VLLGEKKAQIFDLQIGLSQYLLHKPKAKIKTPVQAGCHLGILHYFEVK